MYEVNDKRFLAVLASGLGGCSILVILSYFLFDKPIALWVDGHSFRSFYFFKWINQIPHIIRFLSVFLIMGLGIKSLITPLTRNQKNLFCAAITLSATVYIKDVLKVFFGRYWPGTWYENNPSLLRDNAFGFHFWKWDFAYAAFPSGHTTVVFCAMTFLWLFSPKWRPLALFVCLLQIGSLLALNYHFLGDIIAGAFLGSLCAVFAAYKMDMSKNQTVMN